MSRFVDDATVVSWGRTVRAVHRVARPNFSDELFPLLSEARTGRNGVLAIGLRRSYGNSNLNPDGALIDMTRLNRLIAFDGDRGIVSAQAGLSLAELTDFLLLRGYFLPVTPGTRYVTLGGAVANDVHGKNHHSAGTFGRWVRELELLRSDGSRVTLRPDDPTGLFAATIGGLGLTGIITKVTLALRRVRGGWIETETIPFSHVDEFFALARESEPTHEYTVAWIDVLARGQALGRGLFTRANHAERPSLPAARASPGLPVPFEFPAFALNRASVSAFNALYFALGKRRRGRREVPYGSFFYPLDSLRDWNRLYGSRGFFQYQCVVPTDVARDATIELLRTIAAAGQGSFLVVLKTFGDIPSPGLLSFPMAGTTLALDFPNRGEATLRLMARLDAIVAEARGRLYPAKDGRLPAALFRSGYPLWERFAGHVDPAFSSAFWRSMGDGSCRSPAES